MGEHLQFRSGRGNIFAAFAALGLLLGLLIATEHAWAQQPTPEQISEIGLSVSVPERASVPERSQARSSRPTFQLKV